MADVSTLEIVKSAADIDVSIDVSKVVSIILMSDDAGPGLSGRAVAVLPDMDNSEAATSSMDGNFT